jgi:hypothetical protein
MQESNPQVWICGGRGLAWQVMPLPAVLTRDMPSGITSLPNHSMEGSRMMRGPAHDAPQGEQRVADVMHVRRANGCRLASKPADIDARTDLRMSKPCFIRRGTAWA